MFVMSCDIVNEYIYEGLCPNITPSAHPETAISCYLVKCHSYASGWQSAHSTSLTTCIHTPAITRFKKKCLPHFQALLEVIHPSSLLPMCGMQPIYSPLSRLILIWRPPNLFSYHWTTPLYPIYQEIPQKEWVEGCGEAEEALA